MGADRRHVMLAVALAASVAALTAAAGVGARATSAARTTADEPQYLLTAGSLVDDLDLDIADEIAVRAYEPYHEVTIDRQTRLLEDGRQISPHDPLLPALLAVPYAIGGWVAAKIALALVAAATAALAAWSAIRRFGVGPHVAGVVVAGASAGIPLAAYGGQVYPELPGGLVVLAVLVAVGARPVTTRHAFVAGVGVTALPWLAVKYVPIAAVLALALLLRLRPDRRRIAVATGALVASGIVYLALHRRWYGGWTVYSTGDHFEDTGELSVVGTDVDLVGRSRRVVALLVDREFGIAAWSPIWLLLPVAVGLAFAARSRAGVTGRPGWEWWAVVAVGWAGASFLALTMHGWWVPGRQLVVVLPAAVVLIAVAVDRWRRLVVPAVGAGVLGAVNWLWLAAEASTGRRTLVVDFMATAAWPYRLTAPVLPSGIDDRAHDVALLAGWAVVTASLAMLGLRAGRAQAVTVAESDRTATGVESVAASRWHFDR